MKKLLTFLILSGFAVSIVMAQISQPQQRQTTSGPSVRLHGYATYAFDDNNVDSYYSATEYFDGKIKGGFQYGGGLEIMPYPAVGVEFMYLRLDSKAPMEYYSNGVKSANFDLAQNWLFLSFNKYVTVNPMVEPFAGFQVGMDIINVENPSNGYTAGATKFAWGAKIGTHVWVNEKVGLKLQASLLSAVQAVGGGLYFGTGGGGAGVTGFSTYYQFNLGGGLVFNLR